MCPFKPSAGYVSRYFESKAKIEARQNLGILARCKSQLFAVFGAGDMARWVWYHAQQPETCRHEEPYV